MRILAIAPTAFYNDYGCHVRILGQLEGLQSLGHTVRLVTYPVGRDVEGIEIRRTPLPGLRHIPVGSSRRKLLLDALLEPTALAATLTFRPHVIHAYLHEGALIGWPLAVWRRTPLTFDYQGSLTAEMLTHNFLHPRSLWRPWLEKLEHWLDRRPNAIFTSTQRAFEAIHLRGVSKRRLHYLPDAVDPALFHPQRADADLAREIGLRPDLPTIVYLGLLAPYQGVDLLLQAVARLSVPVQFLIMGFPHVEHYRQMAKSLGVDAFVHFTGPIPYRQAPRYLALGDIAIASKLHTTEGSGKLLPYMSMALPIIATDTPAHRQYLGDLGLYVAPDPEALARVIEQSLDRLPELRALGGRLRAQVKIAYTWEQTSRVMERVFKNLLTAML